MFDLSSFVGKSAAVTIVSFVAYLLGALSTLSVDGRFFSFLAQRVGEASQTNIVDQLRLREMTLRLSMEATKRGEEAKKQRIDEVSRESRYSSRDPESLLADIEIEEERLGDNERLTLHELREEQTSYADLRIRLLVANQELYGEHDRVLAEATFRVNLFLPMIAYGLYSFFEVSLIVGALLVASAFVLLIQGLMRLSASNAILARAVVAGVIEDPVQLKIKELKFQTRYSRIAELIAERETERSAATPRLT